MKKISGMAFISLKEAIAAIFWFKQDLMDFLNCTLLHRELLIGINLSVDTKLVIVDKVFNNLNRNDAEICKKELFNLYNNLKDIDDFTKLKRSDNPEQRIEKAKEKLNIMNKYWKPYACIELELETKKQHQTNYIKNIENQQIYNKQLNELKEQMLKLNSMSNAQERGYQLEHFLNMLFYFFDLNPSKSYKIKGEQIDGAFSFDGTDYLIEAKWQKELINATGLLAFAGKIAGKLKNTLGLYVSFNGFSKEALQIQNPLLHSIILMDGYDLTMIVEGRIKLTDMLSQKHFHASKTGENLYRCIC